MVKCIAHPGVRSYAATGPEPFPLALVSANPPAPLSHNVECFVFDVVVAIVCFEQYSIFSAVIV